MNDIPKRFINNVKTTPHNVCFDKGRGYRYHQQYADLYATLKLIKVTESVQVTKQEAMGLFGKGYEGNIEHNMKKKGLKRPKVVTIDNTVYISNSEA